MHFSGLTLLSFLFLQSDQNKEDGENSAILTAFEMFCIFVRFHTLIIVGAYMKAQPTQGDIR